jgi:menaquinone-9 beta-reductase
MAQSPEIVIVGAGVGGGAIACALARAGLDVAILERSERHIDRVRGEWLAPWGVAEASTLGLIDSLEAAGGRFMSRNVGYDETTDPESAEAHALDFHQIHPNGFRPMSIGHPVICDTFDDAAVAADARLMRGVNDIKITPGIRPEVEFVHLGGQFHWRPTLILAADGRNSTVRRQLGMMMSHDRPHSPYWRDVGGWRPRLASRSAVARN